MDGTEVRLTNLFAEIHNMSTIMVVDEPGQWGTIFDNWTGFGIVGNIVMDKGDIGLGLFLNNNLKRNFLRHRNKITPTKFVQFFNFFIEYLLTFYNCVIAL